MKTAQGETRMHRKNSLTFEMRRRKTDSIFSSSLVKLGAGARRSPTEVHPLAQPVQSAAAGAIVALALAHDLFQKRRQHSADGSSFFGGEDANPAEERSVELQSHIGFHSGARVNAQHNLVVL